MSTIKVKIYYYARLDSMSENVWSDILVFGKVTKKIMERWHVLIYEFEDIKDDDSTTDEYLDSVYSKFNSNDKNPLSIFNSPTRQKIIKELQTHTSMSIGDIVEVDGTMYVVNQFGFKKIE